MRKRFTLTVVFLFILARTSGMEEPTHSLQFEINKGQWPAQVKYMSNLQSGRIFLESNRFTFVYYSEEDLERAHHGHGEKPGSLLQANNLNIRCHAYRVRFAGSLSPVVTGEEAKEGYSNYFIGSDRSRWATHVTSYEKVNYAALYPGIDMKVHSSDGHLKVDFVVAPHANPAQIRYVYEGIDGIALHDGNLVLQTSVAEIVEQKPYAYQVVNGQIREVACRYRLENGAVSFDILSAYAPSLPLVIDPVIVASTYSGSHSKTYGHCASYDVSGNIFTGGRCFGAQYPVTDGAFDMTFGGGQDIAISKLNPTGSALIFATYLGGARDDYAHSLFIDNNDELFVYGSSTSPDYPVTPGCFHQALLDTFSDIVVTHLSTDGSALIGSTYVGGMMNDGRNNIAVNLGDELKGEISVDLSGNIYVASFTNSPDFPVTPTGFDPTYNGNQDAVVFSLDNTCSRMRWGTFLGDTASDAAYGLKVMRNGEVLVSGSTSSVNFPTVPGCYKTTYSGGRYDGFVLRLLNNTLVSSSFFGTGREDEVFFVETDRADNVYLLGQTNSTLPITNGVYGNPGGRTFIAKLNHPLTSLQFQTVIGGNGMQYGIAPTAFMVDVCDNIYFSGFGDTLSGYPVTNDAFYATDSLSRCFYVAKLARNADSLIFGTFYGGDHVDGGTSRFDKNGIIYQAVCQGGPGFPTLPTAYAVTTTLSWDICVFKVDFQNNGVHAKAQVSPSTHGCMPYPVNFTNLSTGTGFTWNFGDGSPTDTSRNPVHTFTDTGEFHVTMVAVDTNTCNYADTLHLVIRVRDPLPHNPPADTLLCGQSSIQLVSPVLSRDFTYCWQNNAITSSIAADTTGIYWVRISNGACSTVDSFLVSDLVLESLGPDTLICVGQPVTLHAQSNGSSYHWSTGANTSSMTTGSAGIYWVDATLESCTVRDSILVDTVSGPSLHLGKDTLLCPGTVPAILLNAGSGTNSVLWSTGDTTYSILAGSAGLYSVRVYDGYCTSYDTLSVTVSENLVHPQDSVYFCDIVHAVLDAQVENVSYLWNTGDKTQRIRISKEGTYWFQVTYNYSCVESDTIEVNGEFGQDLLFVPNAFTPNGDGLNDIFLPAGDDVRLYDMQIFNRWGKSIFNTTVIGKGWDGRTEGRIVQPGVYVYKIGYATPCAESRLEKTGCVLVVE